MKNGYFKLEEDPSGEGAHGIAKIMPATFIISEVFTDEA